MLLEPSQAEKHQEKCNDLVRIVVADQIKRDYPKGKQLINLSHTFVISYHDSFCYHGELYDCYGDMFSCMCHGCYGVQ